LPILGPRPSSVDPAFPLKAQDDFREAFLTQLDNLSVKIFADGADLAGILELYKNPLIKGFTTNPTLMKQAGIGDCAEFARALLNAVPDRPVSFEVFADDFEEMEWQAFEIASWGGSVVVKIPVTNTHGESSAALIRRLACAGVRLNVTAMMTLQQVQEVADCLRDGPPSYISVFAGRIADTGRDPVPLMAEALGVLKQYSQIELIWASPRELLNIFQADEIGCQVITVTHDLLKKLHLVGKDLSEYSLETVRMFFNDAQKAGFRLTRSTGGVRGPAKGSSTVIGVGR
jgi:transaldolase